MINCIFHESFLIEILPDTRDVSPEFQELHEGFDERISCSMRDAEREQGLHNLSRKGICPYKLKSLQESFYKYTTVPN